MGCKRNAGHIQCQRKLAFKELVQGRGLADQWHQQDRRENHRLRHLIDEKQQNVLKSQCEKPLLRDVPVPRSRAGAAGDNPQAGQKQSGRVNSTCRVEEPIKGSGPNRGILSPVRFLWLLRRIDQIFVESRVFDSFLLKFMRDTWLDT